MRELPRKEKKAYSQLRRSFRAEILWFELSKVCRDPHLEEDVMIRLNRRKRKRISEEEVNQPTASFFNNNLACFNAIKSCNMSMAAWDNLRLWIKDYNSRGGDVLNLPSSSSLRSYRDSMVPNGLLCSTTSARIPLQNVLQHTAERILLRPDTQDFLDLLEDGTVLELLWKWGMDGQTGNYHYLRYIIFMTLKITYISLISL